MTIELELQLATTAKTLPHPSQFKEWVSIILSDQLNHLKKSNNVELTIRIVDEQEITYLNNRYRDKEGPTNVLSFPVQLEEEINYNLLGDIVICAQIVESQAKQQNKELLSHWAHMVIHGILHLLGYDHQNKKEANIMEDLEERLMQELGFVSPY